MFGSPRCAMTSVASSQGSDACLSWLSEGTCVDVPVGCVARSRGSISPAFGSSSPLDETLSHQRSAPLENEQRQPHSTHTLLVQFRQQMLLEARQASVAQQTAVDPGVRMIVVSWMVEVAEEFRLQQETLHAAVLLLDRFMANSEDVPRCVLQLLAIGCILLASKELEVSHPTVDQLCAVTANHFKPHDLLRMERIILNLLDFGVSGPTCYTFLHLLAQVCSSCVTPAVLSLGMYLCELAMLNAGNLGSSYSNKAASALLLAQISIGNPQHTPLMQGAISACMGADGLQAQGPCMAALLRLQQVAYQHTLAAAVAAASAPAPGGAGSSDACRPPGAGFGGAPLMEQAEDLLAPLRVKFGAECWCGVSAAAPMALAGQVHGRPLA